VRAGILTKIPDLYTSRLIAADQLALIWVYHNIVHGRIVLVLELNPTTSGCQLGSCLDARS
jgi:hypothetical protein